MYNKAGSLQPISLASCALVPAHNSQKALSLAGDGSQDWTGHTFEPAFGFGTHGKALKPLRLRFFTILFGPLTLSQALLEILRLGPGFSFKRFSASLCSRSNRASCKSFALPDKGQPERFRPDSFTGG